MSSRKITPNKTLFVVGPKIKDTKSYVKKQ